MKRIEDKAISPVCPDCGGSVIVKTVPNKFLAPQHIAFSGRCEKCGQQVGVMYSFNERRGIEQEREANVTNPKMLVIH